MIFISPEQRETNEDRIKRLEHSLRALRLYTEFIEQELREVRAMEYAARVCPECQVEFIPTKTNAKKTFCSPTHQKTYNQRKRLQKKRAARPVKMTAWGRTESASPMPLPATIACGGCAYGIASQQAQSGYLCSKDSALQCKPWTRTEAPFKKEAV